MKKVMISGVNNIKSFTNEKKEILQKIGNIKVLLITQNK